MADGFSKEDLDDLYSKWNKLYELQQKAADGLKGYNSVLKDIREVSKQLKYLASERQKIEKQINLKEKEQNKLLAKAKNLKERNKIEQSKEYKELEKAVKLRKVELGILDEKTSKLKENAAILSESVNTSNLMAASFKSIGRGAFGLFQNLKGISKELLDEMKSVRNTEKSMGILSSQSAAFRDNLYKTAGSTQRLGVGVGELAKMQGSYSEQIGRSVQLSQEGLEAMAEMASGTMLGSDGAAEMAAGMESFGISAIASRDIIEDTMNLSSKMGVNSVKVLANLKKNMQLANRFHFKDGVKGMTRLAAAAAKMKLDMEGISGMADKVFRPEGAVEMASKLQTMGGEFSKLADPFELMFKARNDFEGFAQDIGNATKEFTTFNAATGEFEISGLQLDRMKEIATISGIPAEKLAEMGKQAKKLDVIQSQMSGNLSADNQEFLAGVAEYNKDKNEWVATVNGQTKSIKAFSNEEVKKIAAEKKTLAERAKQAQTFDESWQNIKNTFKTILLPFLEEFGKAIEGPMQDFLDWLQNSGGFETMFEAAKDIGRTVGSVIKTIGEFIINNPIASGVMALVGSAAIWMARGVSLGMGFNSVARGGMGGGMGGSGGAGNMMGGRFMQNTRGKFMSAGMKRGGMGGKMLRGMGGKYGVGTMRGMGAGMGLGMLGMGADMWRGSMDDPDSMGGKALGVGGTMANYAGMGMMLGPWGGLIGAGLGLGKGLYDEFAGPSQESMQEQAIRGQGGYTSYDDVIIRAGQPPVGINPADDVMAMKKDGPVDKALAGGGGSGGTTKVTFTNPMKIEGTLTLATGAGEAEVNLDDPILLRNLSNMIQQELSKSVGGGKISANPA